MYVLIGLLLASCLGGLAYLQKRNSDRINDFLLARMYDETADAGDDDSLRNRM